MIQRTTYMENFKIYNPVKVHFGKGVVEELDTVVQKLGTRVLFVYGKGSIKQNGIYDEVMSRLNAAGCNIKEFQGIKPNPLAEDVDAAANIGREHNADVIIAVGGGSVIDSAKLISALMPLNCTTWDLMTKKVHPVRAIPLIAILTLAATGSEMNSIAVVQNEREKSKIGFSSPVMFPVHSFLDPDYTKSVPANYTAYGVTDLIAHAMEAWFGSGESKLADRFVISIIKEAMEAGPALLKDLENYDLRARIMYAATMALNGTCVHGKKHGDWGVHALGHVISLLYDTPHGAALSIFYPAWLTVMKERIPERIQELLYKLFGTEKIEDGTSKLKQFFKMLGCPVTLNDAGIDISCKKDILEVMIKNRASGMTHDLTKEDYKKIVDII